MQKDVLNKFRVKNSNKYVKKFRVKNPLGIYLTPRRNPPARNRYKRLYFLVKMVNIKYTEILVFNKIEIYIFLSICDNVLTT